MQYLRLKAPPDAAQQNARDIIERQVKHLIRLVDDLLDISRISSGKISLQKERVSLALIVTNAIEASRPLIESENHQLTVTLPAAPVYLDADLTRLVQVLQNLLNNAARYTPPGGKIALQAEFDGQQVVIRVTDTGIGIPRDMLSHVFDMFTQVDRSIERSSGGLGIGLTLVRRLVELHGGNVEAHRTGRTKAVSSSSACRRSCTRAKAPRRLAMTRWRRPRVFASWLLMTTSTRPIRWQNLRASGHDVHTEYDGAAAVRAARSHRPDVVLLDIGLPKLNGYDTAREIRAIDPQNPVVLVAVTGWGQDEDRRRSRQAGFDHHLVKPVDPELLDRILASVVLNAA